MTAYAAQAQGIERASGNPCQSTPTGSAPAALDTHGLALVERGTIVYDANQQVCWLADANLAGSATIRAEMNVAGINPDGTMDYATALDWVNALNAYEGGRGYLGHHDWQLPDTPLIDPTCSSNNNGSFGVSCTGSGLANLYSIGLGMDYPDSVVTGFASYVRPFLNLQPSLYWTSDAVTNGNSGQTTFSFNTGLNGSNTTKYNYLQVLPMSPGPIGEPPSGTGVLPYIRGSAAGKAVYDTHTQISWALNANLAASNDFGVTGTTTISSNYNGSDLTVPLLDADGSMLYATAGTWLQGMNSDVYAGSGSWTMPALLDLQTLYNDLGLESGTETNLEFSGRVGPFLHLQPGFYWACERDQDLTNRAPCDPSLSPAPGFAYSFDFEDGFMGTDLLAKEFYVMVYFPATRAR